MVDLDTAKAEVARVARENGASLAVIFGSVARGTATSRSDLDVLFVEDTDEPFLARLDRYLSPLVDRLRVSVEVLVYSPDELARMAEGPFIARALAEGVVAHES